jgi:hypothetical protein
MTDSGRPSSPRRTNADLLGVIDPPPWCAAPLFSLTLASYIYSARIH